MMHVSIVIQALLSRADLPVRVADRRTHTTLIWSESDHAYVVPGGRYVVWASTIRRGWGRIFGPAPAPQPVQQEMQYV
jgi:hypothetical protein